MKKRLIAMTLAAVMTLSLAACGSGGGDSAGTEAAQTGAETSETEAESSETGAEARTVRIWFGRLTARSVMTLTAPGGGS